MVVGVGSTGHDVAQDLVCNGADVTMVQRNPTSIVDLESANLSYAIYRPGVRLDEADLMSSAGFILPVLAENFRCSTNMSNERDRPLLDRLEAAGMRLDDGPDGTGWFMKFYQRAGGYYINVGCSELIADGTIRILPFHDMLRSFSERGIDLVDGRVLEADVVVLADRIPGPAVRGAPVLRSRGRRPGRSDLRVRRAG